MEKGLIDVGVLLEPIDMERFDFIRLAGKERWVGYCFPPGRDRDRRCNGLRLGNPRSYFYPPSGIGEMEGISGYLIRAGSLQGYNVNLKPICGAA